MLLATISFWDESLLTRGSLAAQTTQRAQFINSLNPYENIT
jgi:hypothetical protein